MTPTADNPRLEALIRSTNERVLEAQKAYYDGEPIMEDAEYDVLEARLKGLIQTSPWFANLATALRKPGDRPTTSGRVRHTRPMLSIENKYEKPEITDFFRTLPTRSMLLEPKRDGISCELRYRDQELVQALTRGSGTEGEDCTAQTMQVKAVPKRLDASYPAVFNVRGEFVMRKSELERINKIAQATGGKEYSSTRNLTAGTMKLKDVSEVAKREILFIPWEVYGGIMSDSAYDRMKLLEGAGFPKYEGWLVGDEEHVLPILDQILEANKKSDIAADGVVAKACSHEDRLKMGNGSKFANYQVCYKPQSASGTTYLRSIEWQVGRQGKLTPVATCDPVPLAGAMVTRATLNNITWIDAMGLRLGAKVEMLRSGDVIPQIVKVLDDGDAPIVPPTTCPECHTKLEVLDEERSGIITHWCQNYECAGRVRDLFTFIGSRDILEIDGLGPEMATKIVNDGYARDLGELFEFQFEALKGLATLGAEKFEKSMTKKGFSGVTFRKMVISMEKAKTAPWERWIACLGIPMIGRTLGKVLASALNLDGESMCKLPEILATLTAGQVEGIGEVKLDMIQSWAKEARNQEICIALYKSAIRPTNTAPKAAAGDGPKPLTGTAFCITGEFTEDRGKITEKLVSLGAVSKSGVTSKCNLLIVGEGAGKTKLTKANQLGIKQVGKEWLVTTLTENGMELKGNGGFEPEEA